MKNFLLLISIPFLSFGQGWEQTYGGIYKTDANDFVESFDNGYVILGRVTYQKSTDDFDANRDMIIIKIDADGQTQWSNTFFGSMEYDPGYSIQPTSDSGYIIAGWTKTYENPNQIYGGDALLLKLDSYGNQEWVQAYEGFMARV